MTPREERAYVLAVERLTTIVDEAAGFQSVQPIEDTLTALEQHLFAERQRTDAWRAFALAADAVAAEFVAPERVGKYLPDVATLIRAWLAAKAAVGQ